MNKRYKIDYKYIHFINNDSWVLIVIIDEPNGTSTDHEFSPIHNDLFDRVVSTHQKVGIALNRI